MHRYKVIGNPSAGGGSGVRHLSKVERILAGKGILFEAVKTNQPWHAVDLSCNAVLNENFDVIVAVGGDGTANEVLNGLMEAKQQSNRPFAMGVIGAGRGNDFADTLGIPSDLERACNVLISNQRQLIDIGKVTGGLFPYGRYFGNCVGVGFDAIGTIEVAKLPRLGGFLSYLIAVLKTVLLYYRAPLTKIIYDSEIIYQKSLLVSVMNGRRLGGGFLMAPNAEPNDGLFDLCIADEMSRLRMFAIIPHFLRGTQATQKEIKTGRAAKITILAEDGVLPAQTDGEIISIDGNKLDIEVLPNQLEVICPLRKGGT